MITALACVRRLLTDETKQGYQTPATAFGVDLIRGLPGFHLEVGRVLPA